MKILIIDDEPTNYETLSNHLTDKFGEDNVTTTYRNFSDGRDIVSSHHQYEVVIIDLFNGAIGSSDKVGADVWADVQKGKFVPVIIYSAFDGDLDFDFPIEHPILKRVIRQGDSYNQVHSHLKELLPLIEELREVGNEFNESIKDVLTQTAPFLWEAEPDPLKRTGLLKRSARRRLAAKMDQQTFTGEKLQFWEQYLIPPVEEDLLMGDLIRVKKENKTHPVSYRLILTPSCDLARNGKVRSVLVAKCESSDTMIQKLNIKVTELTNRESKKNAVNKLKSSLNDSHVQGYVYLPDFASEIPAMVANLRDLALIPLSHIKGTQKRPQSYERVASVDSPFREQIAWAYLQIAGRPGVPDRDSEKQSKKILNL